MNERVPLTKHVIDKTRLPPKGKRWFLTDTKVLGLRVSITSTGTRTFLVYRWVNGRPERFTLGRYPDLTIEQARGKAGAINAAIAKGENPNDQVRASRAELTLENLLVMINFWTYGGYTQSSYRYNRV